MKEASQQHRSSEYRSNYNNQQARTQNSQPYDEEERYDDFKEPEPIPRYYQHRVFTPATQTNYHAQHQNDDDD